LQEREEADRRRIEAETAVTSHLKKKRKNIDVLRLKYLKVLDYNEEKRQFVDELRLKQ
jgi:hypothetical protein